MTALCGGGTSTTRPGVPSSVYVDQQFVQSLLPPTLAFLYPYLPWMQGLQIGNVGTFCSTDPPAVPSLPSASDFLLFIAGGYTTQAQVVNQFLIDLTQRYLWDQLCMCSVGTATAPTPPSNPGNLPAVNPAPLSRGTRGLCFELHATGVTLHNDGSGNYVSGFLFGSSPIVAYPAIPNPYGCIQARMTVHSTGGVHDATGYTLFTTMQQGPLQSSAGHLYTVSSPTTPGVYTLDIYPGGLAPVSTWNFVQGIQVQGRTNGTASTDTFDVDFEVTCGGGCGSLIAPCCPPDPVLMALLQRINTTLELVQRQAVPFAYIASTVHSGLTGSGTLSVQGLIGAKVDLTTIPSTLGSAGTSPTEYFDLGFITWGTADGYPQSIRIDHDPLLSLPSRCSAFTTLAYDLHPGVVATITELVREP